MSTLRVNKIVSLEDGPVEFTKGITFPATVGFGNTTVGTTQLGIGISSPTGILTAPTLNTSSINITGVCTATTFTGVAGAVGLTNIPGLPNGKAIALTLVT